MVKRERQGRYLVSLHQLERYLGRFTHDVGARESARGEYALRGRGKFESSRDRLSARLYRPNERRSAFGSKSTLLFFAPVGAAVKATQIGQAMFEVTARRSEFANGDRLGTRSIIRFSDAYQRRRGSVPGASFAKDQVRRQ